MGDRLTLNLGVRYDWDSNAHSEKLELRPFLPGNQPHDNNNVAPRMGVNFRLNDRTVLRGGYGLFFAFSPNDGVQQSYSMVHRFEYQIANNGRPDFVPNWFGPGAERRRRVWRTEAELGGISGAGVRLSTTCPAVSGVRSPRKSTTPAAGRHTATRPRSESSTSLATRCRSRRTTCTRRDASRRPSTTRISATTRRRARTTTFNDISRRPFPDWGVVLLEYLEGWSEYHGTDLTFTKRFSNRWQATATYTLGFFKDGLPVRPQWYLGSDGIMARRDVGFPLAADMGGDYGYAGAFIAGGAGPRATSATGPC